MLNADINANLRREQASVDAKVTRPAKDEIAVSPVSSTPARTLKQPATNYDSASTGHRYDPAQLYWFPRFDSNNGKYVDDVMLCRSHYTTARLELDAIARGSEQVSHWMASPAGRRAIRKRSVFGRKRPWCTRECVLFLTDNPGFAGANMHAAPTKPIVDATVPYLSDLWMGVSCMGCDELHGPTTEVKYLALNTRGSLDVLLQRNVISRVEHQHLVARLESIYGGSSNNSRSSAESKRDDTSRKEPNPVSDAARASLPPMSVSPEGYAISDYEDAVTVESPTGTLEPEPCAADVLENDDVPEHKRCETPLRHLPTYGLSSRRKRSTFSITPSDTMPSPTDSHITRRPRLMSACLNVPISTAQRISVCGTESGERPD